MVGLNLVFLGTASAIPTPDRALTSVVVRKGGEILMFDAGEGLQTAMLKAGVSFNRRMKIFISHLHGDHCLGLIGLLQTMSLMNREHELSIYGPQGLRDFVLGCMKYLRFSTTFPLYIGSVRDGMKLRFAGYQVSVCRGEHSIASYAYRLEEDSRPGIFYPEKALEFGVPKGKLWGRLQKGRAVVFGGRTTNPEDVTGPKRPGRVIGFSGDTRPSRKLADFFKEADLLVFESTFGSDLKDKAIESAHSTAEEAGLLARDARVKLLVLNHFSARYRDARVLVAEASKHHPDVVAASDLMQVEVLFAEQGLPTIIKPHHDM